MIHYPLGILTLICIFNLSFACCWLQTKIQIASCLFYAFLLLLWIKYKQIHWPYKKVTIFAFILSGLSVFLMLQEVQSISQKRFFTKGTFTFEKRFQTKENNLGGIGILRLEDGTQRTLYLHTRKQKEPIDPSYTYQFSGYVKPLINPFVTKQNFSFYLWSRGIRYHATQAHLYKPSQTTQFLQLCRNYFAKALTLKDILASSVFQAILMGKKEAIPRDQLQHFFYTGTMHLFAVSGLHVGVVSSFIFFMCKLLLFPRWLKIFFTGISVLFYASIVGFSPSTLRATCMVFFVLLAQIFNRPIDIRAAFFNTIGLTLLFNPYALWDVGFQLSYGVVASILCIGIPLAYTSSRNYSTWRATCIISLCASAMSSLFSIYYWNLFSPWAFIANLFLIPLASGIVILGLISALVSFCCPFLLPLIHTIAQISITCLLKSVTCLESFPWATLEIKLHPQVFCGLLFLFLLKILPQKKPVLD